MASIPAPQAVVTAAAPAPVGPYNQAGKAAGRRFCAGPIATFLFEKYSTFDEKQRV
jgi:hypothetical protein